MSRSGDGRAANHPARSAEPRWPLRPSPAVGDAMLAGFVTVVVLLGAYGESYPTQPEYAAPLGNPVPHVPLAQFGLVVASGAVLAWRRRDPVAVWAVSLAAALAYSALGRVNGAVVICPLVALYTVVVARRRIADSVLFGIVTAAAIFVVGGLFGPFGWVGGGQDVIPFVVAAVVFLGLAVANRRSLVEELAQRAEIAERTREDEARRRVDAERVRIARELHDVVAHTMAVINVQASAALHSLDGRPEQARDGLRAIRSASKEGLTELRAILDVLRAVDPGPDGGAPDAPASGLAHLDTLITQNAAAGVRTTVTVRGQARPLPATVDLAAYRIVQEALTNAVRHAASADADVVLTFAEGLLDVEVRNGGGVSATGLGDAGPATNRPAGHGLDGMAERASALGGTVEAGPTAAGGFRVHATLPLARS